MKLRYDVVQVFGLEALIHAVNAAIDEGWEPIGGYVPVPYKIDWYGQAMVKRVKK